MQLNKAFLLTSCLVLSVLAHLAFFYAWLISGTYDFTAPINHAQWIEVNLAHQLAPASSKAAEADVYNAGIVEKKPAPAQPPASERKAPKPETAYPEAPERDNSHASHRDHDVSGAAARQREAVPEPPPSGRPDELLKTTYEKLTYLISIFGLPVGTAELEAKNVHSEVRITLRVTSNAAISSIYPVDDTVETRHIDGKYILTTIRQQEGSFKSDEQFSINLRKKRVTWVDNREGRSHTVTVPTDDLFDTLSAIYFLRNRQLQIGRTETLHVFDSEAYADVPVEILRRETVRLPNLTTIDALVVQPLQKSAGIFRRTGDIQIWMTDDAFKVPVKIVTSVALGTVTVELVSAESKAPEEKAPAK